MSCRTAELLLVLARVDVLCNENSECLTKLAGVKYIIESAGRKLSLSDHEKSKTSNESSPINCVEPIQSDDEFQIITPVNSVKPFAYWSPSSPEKSPTLSFKTSFNNWQSHSGNCIKCKHVMFYHLRLELAFLQIEYDYLMTESWESVKDSFSELLKYVKMWKGVVEALFLHKFNAKKKRPKTSGQKTDEPLLQFDLLTCRILCKMAYMQMQCNYLAEAHETIKNAYFKIKNLPWIGLSHCYHLKSLAIYFFCLIKLLLMTKADSLSFSDFLDKIWSTQKLPHLEPECSEIDFLTAKVDNVVLSDKVVDSFKTPRVVNIKSAKGKTRCQCTKLSSKKVCDFQTCSLCTPSMCHAPIKKFSALSSYENAFSEYELEVNVNKSRKGRRKKPLETESKANFSGDDSIQEDECEIVYIDPAINNENHLQNSKHKKSKKTSVIQCCPQNETALKELTLQYNTEECKETVVMTNNKKGKDSVRRTNSKSSSCDGAEVETMNRLRSSSRQKTKKDVELARANNDSEGFLESRKLRRSLRVVEMGASTNRRNEDVITPLSADSIKNSTKTQMGSKVRADAKSSEDSFLNESFSEIEVLRCESSPEVIRISERKVRENNDALKSHSNKGM